MKFKRLALAVLAAISILSITPAMTFADTADVVSESTERAVSTGYKYKKINGVCYRRLWNYTDGVWVDAYWTLCPDSSHNH